MDGLFVRDKLSVGKDETNYVLLNALLGELFRNLNPFVNNCADLFLDAWSPGLVCNSILVDNCLEPVDVFVHVVRGSERKHLSLLLAKLKYRIYIVIVESRDDLVD